MSAEIAPTPEVLTTIIQIGELIDAIRNGVLQDI